MAGAHPGQAVDEVIVVPGGDVVQEVLMREQGPSGVVLVPEGGGAVKALLYEPVVPVVGIAYCPAVAVGARLQEPVEGAVCEETGETGTCIPKVLPAKDGDLPLLIGLRLFTKCYRLLINLL